jgi:hypothetical protein
MSTGFDCPLTAKARLSRSSRRGTHTRSTQAHFRAAQSSPPRPLWFCIADMHSRSLKGPSRHTTPCDRVRAHPSSDNPAGLQQVLNGRKKRLVGMLPDIDLTTNVLELRNHRLRVLIQASVAERHDCAHACYWEQRRCQSPHSLTASASTQRLRGS